MDRGLQGDAGGIRSLLDLIGEHREAVEYDLIAHGLRLDWLGTPALSWRDLLVIVRQAPAGSAVERALHPKESPWGLSEHLLANLFDVLQAANWQRGSGKEADRPKPYPRPGVTEPENKNKLGKAMSIEAMAELLKDNGKEAGD